MLEMGHRGYSEDDSIKIIGVTVHVFVGKLQAKYKLRWLSGVERDGRTIRSVCGND
jgi:hypothetical protein